MKELLVVRNMVTSILIIKPYHVSMFSSGPGCEIEGYFEFGLFTLYNCSPVVAT